MLVSSVFAADSIGRASKMSPSKAMISEVKVLRSVPRVPRSEITVDAARAFNGLATARALRMATTKT